MFSYWASLAGAYLVLGWLVARRAGKRREEDPPARGPAWKGFALQVLTLLLVGLSWFLLNLAAEKRVQAAHLQSQEMAKSVYIPCQGPEADALPFYKKASEKMVVKDPMAGPEKPGFWLQTPEAIEFLETNRAVLPVLREAGARPDFCVRFDASDLYKSLIVGGVLKEFPFDSRNHFPRLFYLSALERVDKGDTRGALEDLQCIGGMVSQFGRRHELIDIIVAANIVGMLTGAQEAVWARVPSDSDLWSASVMAPQDLISDFRRGLTMDLARQLEFWHWLDIDRYGRFPMKPYLWLALEPKKGSLLRRKIRFWTPIWAWRIFYSKEELGDVKSAYEQIFSALSLPGPQAYEGLVRVGERKEQTQWLYRGSGAEPIWNFSPAFLRVLSAEAGQRLSFAARACYAFHSQKGRWPGTLAELVPDYLEETPVSPFSLAPLGYEQVPGGARLFVPDPPEGVKPEYTDFYVGRGAYEEFRVKPWREALAAEAKGDSP